MSDVRSFNCPNCGSPLKSDGAAKEITCPSCHSTVIVPEELRDSSKGESAFFDVKDPFVIGPQHLQWLIQHGADATAKVDSVKDKGETIVVYWTGAKATGGAFNSHAEIKIERTAMPRRGDAIQIKYNPEDTDGLDCAFQMGGRYYWDTVLWDHWSLE